MLFPKITHYNPREKEETFEPGKTPDITIVKPRTTKGRVLPISADSHIVPLGDGNCLTTDTTSELRNLGRVGLKFRIQVN